MKREARDIRDRMPKPVRRIPLSDTVSRPRLIFALIALAVAAGAFYLGFSGLLHTDPGWTVIEAESRYNSLFSFSYLLGQTGASPRTEQKTVTAIYTLALDQAGLALDARQVSEDPRNLAWLNAHPNTETEVAPLLYRALEQSLSAGRWVFLGPLYELSDSLSASASDAEAAQMDPRRNADSDAFRRELLPLLQSEDHLSLSLLGGNRVCLHVSPACLARGEEYEITRWIDFGWQRDAFLTDSVADALSAAGADHGLLASASGCIRCLLPDASASFAMNLQTALTEPREGFPASDSSAPLQSAAQTALAVPQAQISQLTYHGPLALLSLSPTAWRYADGLLASRWLSLSDGLDYAPADAVVAASRQEGCAALLLRFLPLLTRDVWDSALADSLCPSSCALLAWKDGIPLPAPGAASLLDSPVAETPVL